MNVTLSSYTHAVEGMAAYYNEIEPYAAENEGDE